MSKLLETPRWLIQGATRRMLRVQSIGRPLSAAALATGLEGISRGMSRHSGFVPEVVTFKVNGGGSTPATGRMLSADGTDHIVRAIWVGGLDAYEAPLPQVFCRVMHGAQAVLDIGANSGLYAILAARCQPTCHVYSFEPFPPAQKWLKANIELNALQSRITVEPSAVGATEGTAELYIPSKDFGDTLETSASLNKTFRERHSEVLKVPVVTIDDYLSKNSTPNAPRISVIRADVEGAEHLVLGGAQRTMTEHRPFVFVEVLSTGAADLLEPIRKATGYTAVVLEKDRLIELPSVQLRSGAFNHLWYPTERREEIVKIAADLKMALAAA